MSRRSAALVAVGLTDSSLANLPQLMPHPKPLPEPESSPEEDDPMSVDDDEGDDEISPLLKRPKNKRPEPRIRQRKLVRSHKRKGE